MIRKVLTETFAYTDLTLVGFLIFLVVFTGVLFWAFRPGSKIMYSKLEKLPLE